MEPFVEPWMPELIEALALIQWTSHMTRKVGPSFTGDELRNIQIGAALLRGEQVGATWARIAFVLGEDVPQSTRRELLGDEVAFHLESREPYLVEIGGVSYPIGRSVRTQMIGRIENPPKTWTEVPNGASLVMIPGSTAKASMTLLT
jgi:hypothetical protein